MDNPQMDAQKWNQMIASLPQSHVLQTWQWAEFKSHYGWEPLPTVWHDRRGELAAAAMILRRRLQMGLFPSALHVMYLPKGPLLRDWGDDGLRDQVLDDLRALARRDGAIFVKIDPDVRLGSGIPGDLDACENPLGETVLTDLKSRGWRFSSEQVQYRNTVIVDLTQTEDALLANMKQKTRYNIRLAGRRGVEVRVGTIADLDLLYRMYAETSLRDEFVIRDPDYYLDVWEQFMQTGMAEPLIAEVDNQPVAALVVFRHANQAWYLYGMSRDAHREKMPNYLLQWEAMRRARQAGCDSYDLWGAPDDFKEEDPLWGVYRFKEGLGGKVVRHIGAWDLPVRPFHYWLYTQIIPYILAWMRRRGKAQTQSRSL